MNKQPNRKSSKIQGVLELSFVSMGKELGRLREDQWRFLRFWTIGFVSIMKPSLNHSFKERFYFFLLLCEGFQQKPKDHAWNCSFIVLSLDWLLSMGRFLEYNYWKVDVFIVKACKESIFHVFWRKLWHQKISLQIPSLIFHILKRQKIWLVGGKKIIWLKNFRISQNTFSTFENYFKWRKLTLQSNFILSIVNFR